MAVATAPVSQQKCANHPERPGKALCMRCKKVVCQECATQWDGINYCVNCLKAQRVKSEEASAVLPWASMLAAIIVLGVVARFLIAWSGALLAELL